ncbi:MELT-like protein [Mya arenaria]|uniref:MELT-like protein n=1 Tax=Mya arenaria TaxID=6604 RepID=A0ABY7EZF7_MYAAR|nr:MELT-like protein [Mya arenaria]
MATANPAVFIDHVNALKLLAEQQPEFIHQIVQIVGAAQSASALSQQDLSVSSLKHCRDALYPEKGNSGYITLVTSSFQSAKGQLKEKKGRWKFLKRWKTRYFTLSGSQITYSKNLQRKEMLPVREIQSVKAVRKGICDIPKAFEIFTTDQNYVFKAKGQQNNEPWVQFIHLAVAKAQNDGECTVVENVTIPTIPTRPRSAVRDTKL